MSEECQDYQVCKYCNKTYIKKGDINKYDCEITFRSKDKIQCQHKINICNNCFSPEKVFFCNDHEKNCDILICEYAGEYYEDSPVMYIYPQFGVRRVHEITCKNCDQSYLTCKEHKTVYENCAKCNIQYIPDYVFGLNKVNQLNMYYYDRLKYENDENDENEIEDFNIDD